MLKNIMIVHHVELNNFNIVDNFYFHGGFWRMISRKTTDFLKKTSARRNFDKRSQFHFHFGVLPGFGKQENAAYLCTRK